MTERSTAQGQKRRLILDSAVRVFASKGYHAWRVDDIGTEAIYGALEEILTGWVLQQLDDGDEAAAEAERTVTEVLCAGLGAEQAQAPA